MPRRSDRIEIKHSTFTFLQKAFSDCIDANKQLNHPEQSIPDLAFGFIYGHKQHKNSSPNIKQDAIKAILLPDLKQQVFFEKR